MSPSNPVLRFVCRPAAIVFSVLLIAVPPPPLLAKTITVPTEFDTIQEAVDEAVSGDLILIKARDQAYEEDIVLKDGISLEGEETARTIIDGTGSGAVITAGLSSQIRKLTIRGGLTGIVATNKNSVVISNNIIVDNDTAIRCTNGSLTIDNNTIDNNTAGGISCAEAQSISITNNLVTRNGSGITLNNIATLPIVANNGFFANGNNGEEGEDPIKGGDPHYVETAQNDYHLQSGSPYLGVDLLNPMDDLGAYGGSGADTRPFPITGLSVTAGIDTITLNWKPNLAYNITGYKLYFDKTLGEHLNPQTAPPSVCDSAQCALTSSPLDTTLTTPAAPNLLPPAIGDQRLFLNWTPPANGGNITSYKVYWGLASGNYTAPGSPAEAGNVTSYTLLNLINDITYFIAVKSIARPRFFVSVTAVDNATPGFESQVFADRETLLNTGAEAESPFSNEVQEFPDAVARFPALPDEGGCFIATAAYGSSLAPHVHILRAFRDRYLLPTSWGRRFVALYYRLGPIGASFIQQHEVLKAPVRLLLLPLVGLAYFLLQATFLQKAGAGLALALIVLFIIRLRHRQLRKAPS